MSATAHYITDIVNEQVARANQEAQPLYLLFIATKPCYVKLASVVHALARSSLPHLIIDVGQHYDDVLTSARQELDYASRLSVYLHVKGGLTDRTTLLSERINWLHDLLYKEMGLQQAAIPIVSGDTSTAGLVPVFWYLHEGIRSIHIEAGLRSFAPELDWKQDPATVLLQQKTSTWGIRKEYPYPEGFDTRIASVPSQLLLAPVAQNEDNLLKEGYEEELIRLSGSLSADALALAASKKAAQSIFTHYPQLRDGQWLRVDVHRRENLNKAGLEVLLYGLKGYLGAGGQVVLILTNAMKSAIKSHGLGWQVEALQKVGLLVTDMWPSYLQVLEFIQSPQCLGVYTDSGGLQEETHILDVPCATFRWNTDRPETVRQLQTNVLIPPVSPGFITAALKAVFIDKSIYPGRQGRAPLYGTAVGERIVNLLSNFRPQHGFFQQLTTF